MTLDYRYYRHLPGCPMATCQDELVELGIDPSHEFDGYYGSGWEECTVCQGIPDDHVCTCGLLAHLKGEG